MLPRISLVTPSFNQGVYVEAAVTSVVSQGYPGLEYIVVDGGSTDTSVEVLRRYAMHFAYWTSERDAGQSDALNRGFARATGEVFGWLNSDDVLLPNALHTVGAYFAQHPECAFVTGDGVFIDAQDTRELFYMRAAAYSFQDLLHYYRDMYLPQPSVFFTRRAFQESGGFDPSLTYVMDLDLWLRMRQKFELHYIPKCLSKLRLHEDAKGQRAGQPALVAVEQVTRRYWGRVGRWERAQILWGLRTLQAREEVQSGLRRMGQGNAHAGGEALQWALTRNPLILFSSNAQKILARLLLPMSLRRRVLRAP